MRVSVLVAIIAFFGIGCGREGSPRPLVGSGEIRSSSIAVGSFTFDAIEAGPEGGVPVILLHGFPETGWEFHRQLSALGEATYHAVAPNQRGYSPGARPPAVADYDISLLVQDVLGMADALGFERFHLVGHDWGAAVAWAVADAAPKRLLSLTAISVPHPAAFSLVLSNQDSCQYQASAYVDFFVTPGVENVFLANNKALLRGAFEGVAAEDVAVHVETLGDSAAFSAALNWYRANFNGRDNLKAPLGKTTVRTMYVWSDRDSALCRDGAELTGQYVDAPYRFEVIPGVNHWVPENAADRLSELLLDHFSSGS